MSLPEQAGKVATNAIDAMRGNPSCLAALLVVALYGLLNYFENERQNERIEQRVAEVSRLLDTCFKLKEP